MLLASPKSTSTGPSRGRAVRRLGCAAVLFCLLLGVAGYLLLRVLRSPAAEGCTVRAQGEKVDLDLPQAANAATIAAVGTSRGLPERAVTIALATAMQESKLHNLDFGDRDSLGLFQQRPSQGWGTPQQIGDPVYSSNAFYTALEKVPGYTALPVTVAAQRVQKSGFPQAYAQHATDAAVLSAALTGHSPGALRCTVHTPGKKSGASPSSGAQKVRTEVTREFADAIGSGERKGGVLRYPQAVAAASSSSGSGKGSAPTTTQRGWALAHWAVAHAKDLRIDRVAYGGKVWTVKGSSHGWRGVSHSDPESGATDEVWISAGQQ